MINKRGFFALLCIGAGSAVAWYAAPTEETATTPAVASVSSMSDQQSNTFGTYASLWSKGPANPVAMPEPPTPLPSDRREKRDLEMESARDMRARLRDDPAALQAMIRRYAAERNPQTREMLKVTLSSVDQPEVVELAKSMAASTDAEQRRNGLELLQSLSPDSADVRTALRQVLATEQNPPILVQALLALTPGTAAQSEQQEIILQLQSLVRHADPMVRQQSILRLALWEKNDEATERLLAQALTDRHPEVRLAAATVIAQSPAQSKDAKSALLNIIANGNESWQMRDSALRALDHYPLTQEEASLYRQARIWLGT